MVGAYATNIASVGGIIFNFFDITDTQLLEERLLQAQKMEAVGGWPWDRARLQ